MRTLAIFTNSGSGAIWLNRTSPLIQVPEAEWKLTCSSWQWIKIVGWGSFFLFFLLPPNCSGGVLEAQYPSHPLWHLLKSTVAPVWWKCPGFFYIKKLVLLSHADIQQGCNHGAHTTNREIDTTSMTFINWVRRPWGRAKNIQTLTCPNFES